LESQQRHSQPTQEHIKAIASLQREGFVPVSIATLTDEKQGIPITGSVWHRKSIPQSVTETLARQKANAASALVQLGEREKIFPALRITDDPESLTQFVHRCRGAGVTPQELLWCLGVADRNRQNLSGEDRRIENRVLFGLLLALGEFTVDELPSKQQQPTVEQVTSWFRDDSSSAIHGATGWLLRQWGRDDVVREIDETARPYDPEREWFTLVIDAGEQRFYQTYIVVPPGEYEIGSPADQPGHESDETLHRVRLTRPVAMLDREVTRGEFQASGVWNGNVEQYSPTGEHPMGGPSWYDSVQYCRWLSEKAGLTEADQAYADPNSLDKSQYSPDGDTGLPTNWPLKLNARGFRLPTVAEWEIAARAGMRTKYSFGDDDSLLKRYAWTKTNSGGQTHIAKELRPNLRGLFDIHGNICEWCFDWHGSYPLGGVHRDPVGSTKSSNRVILGGCYNYDDVYCRSANGSSNPPMFRITSNGLRLALVPFSQDQPAAEPESGGTEGVAEQRP